MENYYLLSINYYLNQFIFFPEARHIRLLKPCFPQVLGVGLAHVAFAMHDENAFEFFVAFLAGEIADELLVVAVAGEGVDALQMGFHLIHLPEDGDFLVAAHDLGAQRRGGAVADAQDGGLRIFNVVG